MKEFAGFKENIVPNEMLEYFKASNISLYIKREDQLHPEVSGNKFRKLKYNLKEAVRQNKSQLLTFGGAYSNHITAVAAAGKSMGLKTIGIIRGEELGLDAERSIRENPSLSYAAAMEMKLHFVSRQAYREKNNPVFQQDLRSQFGDFYLIPEGGTNELAVKGCEEILTPEDKEFDFVCCPVGTGGTVAGILNSSQPAQKILGFPALKGDFLTKEIASLSNRTNWSLVTDYHFGGYSKISPELVNFINTFSSKYHIALDPIYTGKMFFGIFDMIKQSAFPPNSRILAIHTGGLQGIAGMNMKLGKKGQPLIDVFE